MYYYRIKYYNDFTGSMEIDSGVLSAKSYNEAAKSCIDYYMSSIVYSMYLRELSEDTVITEEEMKNIPELIQNDQTIPEELK